MTRKVMIVGLIAALVMTLGGPALSTPPAWAQATGDELLPLKQEVATLEQRVGALDAQLQKLTSRNSSTTGAIEASTTPPCRSVPDALMVIEAVLGHCQ